MRRALAIVLTLATTSCSRTIYEAHFAEPAHLANIIEPASRAPFIKCHMTDGRVFVLQKWSIDEGDGTASGVGLEYDATRTLNGGVHAQKVNLADVALIETNRPYQVDVATGSAVTLAIGTTASLVLSLVCFATGSATCFK